MTAPRPTNFENLVDQARKGQQPAPDDTGRNQRDDLRQEQNCPGDRSEPPGRHAVDHARDDETQANRNEAEPHHQPERVEDGPEQIRNLENSLVVLQPDPGHRADAVPAVERVQDGHQERHEHKDSVHEQRRQDEQPADKVLPADPSWVMDPPGDCDSRMMNELSRRHHGICDTTAAE